MSKKLFDNEYGFSVKENNPFFIFPYLQSRAQEKLGKEDIYDLSRGNPGFGFCPAEPSRNFFSFLLTIDTALNSNKTGYRLHAQSPAELPQIKDLIRETALKYYLPEIAEKYLATLERVIQKIIKIAEEEGREFSEMDVLHGIFNYSTLAGGTYHEPRGELITRIVVAGLHREFLKDQDIKANDLILTSGVNEAIGTFFKMLGAEGLGYLKPGDTIAISTPAYAPYFNEVNCRGLKAVELNFDCTSGHVDFSAIGKCSEKIKAIFVITPNNPAGLRYRDEAMQEIADLAEKNDSIIISDEIYSQFYPESCSLWNYDKKRTIFLCGRSKIERAPGLRFGDVLISPEGNAYLTEKFKNQLKAPDFKTEFIWMKAPGSVFASFQHTASVPGPSQILGILHILLGKEEREQYVEMINKNMEVFFEELGMPRNNTLYYSILNLSDVPGSIKNDLSIEQRLYELATEKGVIVVPALKFFSAAEQVKDDKSDFVRVSLANLTPAETREAGKRIREYLQGK